jgi:hypothetical protein
MILLLFYYVCIIIDIIIIDLLVFLMMCVLRYLRVLLCIDDDNYRIIVYGNSPWPLCM